jgi:radical SAM superfamily enzyme YgiQ (UPF0313 family)
VVRVLLVSANREQIPDPIFPLGLAYIAASVRNRGHTLDIVDLCFERRPLKDLQRWIMKFQPDVIGLSLRNVDNAAYPRTVDYLELHRELVDTIHATSEVPVVLGGSGFSILPQAYMEVLGGDWGICGEGEQAFVQLLDALEHGLNPASIPGIVSPPETPVTRDACLPQSSMTQTWQNGLRPARDLFDYARYVRRGGMGNIQTKRGCVFKCSYCTYPLLEGNRFRSRRADDVVDELDALMREYGPHPVFFVDSILNFPRGHVEAICEEILHRNLNVRWSCYATPVKLDRNQARLMARAGCEGIELGTDSVDDGQLKRLGKSFDAGIAEHANRLCMQAGLKVCQTLIFGAPGETPQSIRTTCEALRRMNPTAVVAMTGVRLYPGTLLTQSLIDAGRIGADDVGLLPTFYVDPAIETFLPTYLQKQALEAGNWVLPGLAAPILPRSQQLLRGLGISGPLWRLLHKPWMQHLNRSKFRQPNTSWGIPDRKNKVI